MINHKIKYMNKESHSEKMKKISDYGKKYYSLHKDKYLKQCSKHRGLGFNKVEENPFSDSEPIVWHHINDTDVIALPKVIHDIYVIRPKEKHRQSLVYIIEQIYGNSVF